MYENAEVGDIAKQIQKQFQVYFVWEQINTSKTTKFIYYRLLGKLSHRHAKSIL